MNTLSKIIFVLAVLLVTAPISAFGNSTANVQGQLTNKAGTAVDGSFSMTVRLFDKKSGGTELWLESFNNVTVSHGLFSLQLGSKSSLPAVIAKHPTIWVEVKVESEPPMPRRPLDAAPRAMVANDVSCTGCISAQETAFLQGCKKDQFLGFDGQKWGCVTAAKGPKGDKGEPGKDGEKGAAGKNGGFSGVTYLSHSFCAEPKLVEIPGTKNAVFCALSRVDDDSPGGACIVTRSGSKWMKQTGANSCGAQACTAICMFNK